MSAAREPATGTRGRDTSVSLTMRRAPAPAGAVSSALSFGWRALLKIRYIPEQLFDVVVTPVMFTVMFTYLFGGALAGSPEVYLQFLLPGILVQSVLFTTIYSGFTLNTDISRGVFDRFRSLPIWRPAPVVGAMTGDAVRYTISSLIVIAVGLVMGFRPEAGLPGLVLAVLLMNAFALGFSWIVLAVSLAVRTPATVMTLSWLVMMPLTFASNIYVEPATMPPWLQAVVAANPVSHLVSAVRGLMGGAPDGGAIVLSLATPLLVTAVFAPLTMRLYRRRV